MQEKLKMIADHEEKYGQIGDEVRGAIVAAEAPHYPEKTG